MHQVTSSVDMVTPLTSTKVLLRGSTGTKIAPGHTMCGHGDTFVSKHQIGHKGIPVGSLVRKQLCKFIIISIADGLKK